MGVPVGVLSGRNYRIYAVVGSGAQTATQFAAIDTWAEAWAIFGADDAAILLNRLPVLDPKSYDEGADTIDYVEVGEDSGGSVVGVSQPEPYEFDLNGRSDIAAAQAILTAKKGTRITLAIQENSDVSNWKMASSPSATQQLDILNGSIARINTDRAQGSIKMATVTMTVDVNGRKIIPQA